MLLTSHERPWIHRMTTDVPDTVRIRDATSKTKIVVDLSGSEMQKLEDVFALYAHAFHFPEYFGQNWAAFSECMKDLSWLASPSYLTIVRRAELLLIRDREELPTLIRQLDDIGKYWGNSFALDIEWGGGEVAFNTVLVSDAVK